MNLSEVLRPSRYINHEVNAVRKDRAELLVALAFPDAYEVGMSHLGMKVLYGIINDLPYASAERAFHPWTDVEVKMRASGEPLRTLESGRPLSECDVVGVSLQYELAYPSMLNMLDLGGIPVRAEARTDRHPLVIAGGPCTVNPLPIAPFVDAALIGDGEDAILEIMSTVRAWRATGDGRRESVLRALAAIEGMYVPSVHGITGVNPIASIRRRVIESLETAYYPTRQVVPFCQAVHDRIAIEVSRGCTMGCRFCQAGFIYRPTRARSHKTVMDLATRSIAATGYDEVAFTSLSAGDYADLSGLIREFNSRFSSKKIAVSLPSLRVGAVNREVLREISSVKKTGFTIAPEAGTARLRAVINKDFGDEDFDRATECLFGEGWSTLKLYYMIGLPTETDADIEGIVEMANRALKTAKRMNARGVNINVAISPFVPKPHTPFQWAGFGDRAALIEKKTFIKRSLKRCTVKGHDVDTSVLEAALSRGDERAAELVEAAWRAGARLDAWTESFSYDTWQRAMDACGVDAVALAARTLEPGSALPWDFVDPGVKKKYFELEYRRATEGTVTRDCRVSCTGCGLGCRADGEPEAMRPESPAPLRPMMPRDAVVRKPIRARVRFTKTGVLRHLSHRELMTHIMRSLMRAGITLEYSQGFNPQPKLAFGPPLGVGVAGTAECFDMEVVPLMSLSLMRDRMNEALAEGISVSEITSASLKEPSLQAFVSRYVYELRGADAAKAAPFMALSECLVAREKGTVDIRPLVENAEPLPDGALRMTLRDMPSRNVRLDEISHAVFGVPASELDITRTAIMGQRDNEWVTP